MITNELGEEEITIEYFESYDKDPLSEKLTLTSKIIQDTSVSSDFPDENINQKESENVTTWYKFVDNCGRYICKFCKCSYSTIQTVRQHVKNKHFEEYNRIKSAVLKNIRHCRLKCHICKEKFKKSNKLQGHIRIHHLNNIVKCCFMCHAVFKNDSEMLNHMSSEHKSVRRKHHFCSICGYSTSKLSHFKQHQNIHSRKHLKKCSYCEYSTNRPSNLRIHEHIHTNNKPYICSFNGCDYRCAAKSALYSHRLKHEKEKNMLYCDKCTYSTVYKQNLRKHIDSHSRNTLRAKF